MITGNLHTLSFLAPDGARGLSRDGTARPKSRDEKKRKEEPMEETKEDNNAFGSVTDYSKVNSDRHNTSRTDTFATATSPSRKKQHLPGKIAGEDMTNLNGAYLISGLRHDMREIGKEIKADIQQDMQQLLVTLHKDVQVTLDVIGDTRASTVGVVMVKLKEDIHTILSEAGWPLKVDFSPIQTEFKNGENARQQGYQDQMKQLEDRLGQKIGPLVDELPEMQRAYVQLKKDFEEVHTNSVRMTEELHGVQQTLTADITQAMHHVQELQESQLAKTSEVEAHLEAQLIKYVREQPVNVDFGEIVSSLKDSDQGTKSCFTQIHRTLDSLCGDMTKVKKDVIRMSELEEQALTKLAPKTECDSNWTQTDAVEVSNSMAQTDDKFWKAKVVHKNKNTKNDGHSQSKISTIKAEPSQGRHRFKEKAIFADAEAMKKKARAALIKREYNVFDYYWSTGLAQKVAKSSIFENVTFLFVVLNALWISIDADHNKADILIDAHPMFQVAEHTFCSYFVWELCTRFLAFKGKRRCLKDRWFIFDLTLVSLMVFETWLMSIIFMAVGTGTALSVDASILRLVRIVKVLRLSRLARLMRAVPEIIIFLKGIGAAARSVCAIMALWGILIYVFAVFFVQTCDLEDYDTVPAAMNTLLLEGILADHSGIVTTLSDANPIFWPVIMFFVLLASITLSYMLIGVLVQIVQVIASTEKERSMVGTVAAHLRMQWQEVGHDLDALLNLADFQALLLEPEIALFLNDVGVDMLVLIDMAEMIYEDIAKEQGGVTFELFVEAVLNMRGTNPVTVQDVKSQLRIMKRLIAETSSKLELGMSKLFKKQDKSIARVRRLVLGDDDAADSKASDSPEDEEDDLGTDVQSDVEANSCQQLD